MAFSHNSQLAYVFSFHYFTMFNIYLFLFHFFFAVVATLLQTNKNNARTTFHFFAAAAAAASTPYQLINRYM